MPLYSVTLQPQESSKDHETEAESPEEAIERAEKASPKFKAESVSRFEGQDEVEAWLVEGRCEACGKLLLQSLSAGAPKAYVATGGDEETIYLCLECGDQEPSGGEAAPDLSELPEVMQRDLKDQSPAFQVEMLERWREADEDTRADILAFHESEGPEKVRQVKLKHEDGTPTSADLAGALEAPFVNATPSRSLADALANPALPDRTLKKVLFFRPGDANRAEKALEALADLSRWVAAGADFDLVLEKQNAKRPSTAPALVPDPAYDAAKLAKHWEPIDGGGIEFFGVFGSDDDSPEPLALFSGRPHAEAWIERQEADEENGRSDLIVMVVRDLRGRAWNHLDAPPSRESEASS